MTRNAVNDRGLLLMAAVMGPGAALARAERQGLEANRCDETLPTNMGDQRPIFEKMGISFHGEVEGDPLFTKATLPPGWRKEHTGHSMGLVLLDDKGRERASIFYKAAFYDRNAHMSASYRYKAIPNYSDADYQEYARGVVCDGDVEIWTTDRVKITKENSRGVYNRTKGDYDVKPVRDAQRDKAAAWLDENRPGWKDPLARWDDPPPVK